MGEGGHAGDARLVQAGDGEGRVVSGGEGSMA